MSVLIKGMEMPTSCADCPIGDDVRCALMPGVPAWWAEYDKAVSEKRMHSHCPLVPVPKRGDLIDRDKFRSTVFIGEQCLYSWDELEDAIDYAPTIIPADPPKEET